MAAFDIFYVYKHTFGNGVCYIGKGSKGRAYDIHKRSSFWKSLYLKHSLVKVEILKENLNELVAYELEKIFIQEHKDNNIALCNLNDGGKGGILGYKHSPESKKKISEANKNKSVSEETKKKIRYNAFKQFEKKGHPCLGREMSIETKNKISTSKQGAKESKETKAKKSISQTGRKHDKETTAKKAEKLRDKKTYFLESASFGLVSGDRVYLYEKYGLNSNSISALLYGRAKTQKGFKLIEKGL